MDLGVAREPDRSDRREQPRRDHRDDRPRARRERRRYQQHRHEAASREAQCPQQLAVARRREYLASEQLADHNHQGQPDERREQGQRDRLYVHRTLRGANRTRVGVRSDEGARTAGTHGRSCEAIEVGSRTQTEVCDAAGLELGIPAGRRVKKRGRKHGVGRPEIQDVIDVGQRLHVDRPARDPDHVQRSLRAGRVGKVSECGREHRPQLLDRERVGRHLRTDVKV